MQFRWVKLIDSTAQFLDYLNKSLPDLRDKLKFGIFSMNI